MLRSIILQLYAKNFHKRWKRNHHFIECQTSNIDLKKLHPWTIEQNPRQLSSSKIKHCLLQKYLITRCKQSRLRKFLTKLPSNVNNHKTNENHRWRSRQQTNLKHSHKDQANILIIQSSIIYRNNYKQISKFYQAIFIIYSQVHRIQIHWTFNK